MFYLLRLLLLSLVAAYVFAQLHAVLMGKILPKGGDHFGVKLLVGLLTAFLLYAVHLFFLHASLPHHPKDAVDERVGVVTVHKKRMSKPGSDKMQLP